MYVLRAVLPLLPFSVRAGEYIVVRPGAPTPITAVSPRTWVARPLPPNYGLVLLFCEQGDLIPLSPADAAAPPALRRLAAG